MPWRLPAKKDVEGCEKPRLVAKQTLTRGYPNGETRRVLQPDIIRRIHRRFEANPEN